MLPPTELENQANDHPAAPEQSGYSAAGVLDEMSGADDMSGANEFANGSVPISESHLVDLASSPQVANPASSHAVNRAPSPHVANLTPSLDHEGLPFAGNGGKLPCLLHRESTDMTQRVLSTPVKPILNLKDKRGRSPPTTRNSTIGTVTSSRDTHS